MKQEITFTPLILKHKHLAEPSMGRYRLIGDNGKDVTLSARSALDALSAVHTQIVRRMERRSYESAALIDDSWLTETPEPETFPLPLPVFGAPAEGAESFVQPTVRLPQTFQRGLQILTLEEMRRERSGGEATLIQTASEATKPLTQEDVKRLLSDDELP